MELRSSSTNLASDDASLPVHERLAERILPHLDERMERPRFITALVVGARVCDEFGSDELAADGVTPPWLVFDWYAADALLRGTGSGPLYLPRPRRGFATIYRTAAVGLGFLTEDHRLTCAGAELLRAWEKDEELDGFVDGAFGVGARLRCELARAVERGLTAGHAVRPRSEVHRQLARTLCPAGIGARERRVVLDQLGRTGSAPGCDPHALEMRRELIDALERRGQPVGRPDEAAFFREVAPTASTGLARRLNAIDEYESLLQPIGHARSIVRQLRAQLGTVRVDRFISHEGMPQLAERVRRAAGTIGDRLGDWQPEAKQLADQFSAVRDARSLFESVVRDEETQHQPLESRSDAHEPPNYRHGYRSSTLSRFLSDLGRLPNESDA